ncbi:uncharacterized protein LOC116196072 isoform X2 [Punica granatum]|uniref:Uncharacterized protein LOC116196072 isoform X2 n=1 Tax=Punica granatum TaxID=22663 RepID=A0A6P8CC77_PUNGR|nr:uncharacterized protein LOC116196072 isoform X2 [Punica granatum]
MAAIGNLAGQLMEDEEEAARRTRVFGALKTYCTELLQLIQSPKHQSPAIPALLDFLRSSSSDDLQPFFDYTLFPLLLLLDAAIACRSSEKIDSDDRHKAPDSPYVVSDIVAEGVVNCLEELLKKCRLGMLNQMVAVLKKLTHGALLSPSEATEEFREGIIKCFRALLMNLCPCSDDACSCKQITGVPALLMGEEMQSHLARPSTCRVGAEECLLAFLQSQDAAAAVGHWLSLLLKVGTADALAFFLPGVVSQFTKVLYASKTMMSGAAGNLEAMDHAIRGLAEYLMIVLQDDANASGIDLPLNPTAEANSKMHHSAYKFLEELRQLPAKDQGNKEIIAEESGEEAKIKVTTDIECQNQVVDPGKGFGSFHVYRTKDWIAKTSANVQKLLTATFPQISVHPSTRLRRGLLAAIRGLLSECYYSLKESRVMLLECLCVLVVDDSEEVAASAQEFLEYLFSSNKTLNVEHDIVEILSRLIEKLPKVVLGSEESLALSHAQQLLVVLYYSGPLLVVDQLLHSPVTAARFLDVLSICLSHNSAFKGSLDKLVLARPSGYLPAVAELKAQSYSSKDCQISLSSNVHEVSEQSVTQQRLGVLQKSYELPRMPPWFVYVGSQKLYLTLAQILRLVGLSLMADSRSRGHLSVVADIPLGYMRKLVSEVRMRDYSGEGWQSWYKRSGSGQLLRQASIAVCILNEMIFGLSDEAVKNLKQMFHKPTTRGDDFPREHPVMDRRSWEIPKDEGARGLLIDCIGRILHEYLSPELWNLPLECGSSTVESDGEVGQIPLHLFTDAAMLQQVIIEGIGIFNMCLGKHFASSGFLHSSLYLLLENLVSSNFHVRNASDAVLHVISLTSGYTTVGELVLANADYVIDSICRQLCHLDLNPHVPNVLAAMLSYIGVTEKILPLLEEPMHSVSLELEILGRHKHPDLTIPFLKAVAEIAKSLKREAASLLVESESFFKQVELQISDMEQKSQTDSRRGSVVDDNGGCSSWKESEQLEAIIFKLNNSKRYRRTVGSIAASCLTAATPLLASSGQAACLVALDIIEDGISTLANVEAAYRHEKGTKEAIEEVIQSHSLYQLQDTMDVADEETDENRLLPAMNRIWPFLVACVRNTDPVVMRRCVGAVSCCVQICGGDFFSRRFHTDGSHFWRLLTTSPFLRKADPKEDRIPLRLPYRSYPSEESYAEVSSLKVQVAVLNMIADLSRNKRSSSALAVVLKKVSGLVVGIACSGVLGLRNASINALHGLACIDPDLLWLLLADVYFSLKKDLPFPSNIEFPGLDEILPPPSSSNQYLYVQYGGRSYGFDVSLSSVETVLEKLRPLVFIDQMYS